MNKVRGKIILVDDEHYEKDLLEHALFQKHWEVKVEYFSSAKEALDYLARTNDEIFILISDLHMPGMSGLDFKKAIDLNNDLCRKSIPFVFFSTHASKSEVEEGFDYRVQGYFRKPLSVEEQAKQLDIIIRYWMLSRHPNANEQD